MRESNTEIPFRASTLGANYEGLGTLPVSVLLESVRSLYNVGAFFRTLEAVGGAHLYLAGISAAPPHARLAKTALGADETVRVDARRRRAGVDSATAGAASHGRGGRDTAAAVDVFDWRPRFPVCVVFGHEVDGVSPAVMEACDVRVRIPMLGRKSSLNVATAGGIVIYELLRQYRDLHNVSDRSGR